MLGVRERRDGPARGATRLLRIPPTLAMLSVPGASAPDAYDLREALSYDPSKALRYLRANATRFRLDPARIASLGMLAGGHLATMVALRDDPRGSDGRVNAAVNLDSEHDTIMAPDRVMSDFDGILTTVMGHPRPWSSAELRDMSTVTFAPGRFGAHGAWRGRRQRLRRARRAHHGRAPRDGGSGGVRWPPGSARGVSRRLLEGAQGTSGDASLPRSHIVARRRRVPPREAA